MNGQPTARDLRLAADALAQSTFSDCTAAAHAHHDGLPSLDMSEYVLVSPVPDVAFQRVHSPAGTALPEHIAAGKVAWVAGVRIVGTRE